LNRKAARIAEEPQRFLGEVLVGNIGKTVKETKSVLAQVEHCAFSFQPLEKRHNFTPDKDKLILPYSLSEQRR
jgi:hypothetical protein